MYISNEKEHQDILTIVSSSEKGITEAIQRGIEQLRRGPQHENLVFRTFQVVSIQGTISDDGQSSGVDQLQVVLHVAGTHKPAP
jgi:flavin-binding protein dodecin